MKALEQAAADIRAKRGIDEAPAEEETAVAEEPTEEPTDEDVAEG